MMKTSLSLLLFVVAAWQARPSLSKTFFHHNERRLNLNLNVLSRSLQETEQHEELVIPPCNTQLGSLTADELRARATAIIDVIQPDRDSFEYSYLQTVVLDPIEFGISVHRICAGCEDVIIPADSSAAATRQQFDTFCGPSNYGAVNATFSGLMILPTAEDGEVLKGTLKTVIDMHPTAIALVPSLMWSLFDNGNETDGIFETLLLQLDGILAATGAVLIFPDYMGYAANGEELYKGYTIRKAYETSCVPIVYWAQQYVSQLTDCATAVSTTVGIKGYSEGGLSSVVLADVLYRLGWNIESIFAGGGPYKMSSETITKTFERIIQGRYDTYFRHILALVGSAYSSTYRDLPNFNQGQDMLTQEIRPAIVDLIAESTPESVVREYLPEDSGALLDLMFEKNYLDFLDASIATGNYDPCGSTPRDELVQQNVHLICDAFQLNDVSELLQNAPYAVNVCHSPEDEVVPFESVPDLTGNDNLVFNVVSGNHNEAGGECIFSALIYYLLNPSFQSLVVEDQHSSEGCSVVGNESETTEGANETITGTNNETIGDSNNETIASTTQETEPPGTQSEDIDEGTVQANTQSEGAGGSGTVPPLTRRTIAWEIVVPLVLILLI